ncbi:hypothetical protein PMAYCL1PPCAC_24890, partial [Pristionchus mayeri]
PEANFDCDLIVLDEPLQYINKLAPANEILIMVIRVVRFVIQISGFQGIPLTTSSGEYRPSSSRVEILSTSNRITPSGGAVFILRELRRF